MILVNLDDVNVEHNGRRLVFIALNGDASRILVQTGSLDERGGFSLVVRRADLIRALSQLHPRGNGGGSQDDHL